MLPQPVGKRQEYCSAVGTFYSCTANDLPIKVNDHDVEMGMLLIGDLVEELLDASEKNIGRIIQKKENGRTASNIIK